MSMVKGKSKNKKSTKGKDNKKDIKSIVKKDSIVNKDNILERYKPKIKRNRIIKHIVSHRDEYKEGLLEIDKQEDKYNKLFEQKLSQQYREFRNLKENHLQLKKFARIVGILITIVLIALLLLSFRY